MILNVTEDELNILTRIDPFLMLFYVMHVNPKCNSERLVELPHDTITQAYAKVCKIYFRSIEWVLIKPTEILKKLANYGLIIEVNHPTYYLPLATKKMEKKAEK